MWGISDEEKDKRKKRRYQPAQWDLLLLKKLSENESINVKIERDAAIYEHNMCVCACIYTYYDNFTFGSRAHALIEEKGKGMV